MGVIDIVNRIVKIACINILTYFVLIKLINYEYNNRKKILLACVASFGEALISIIMVKYIQVFPTILLCYTIHAIVISKLIKSDVKYAITLTFISLAITYSVYIISIAITGTVLKVINYEIPQENPILLFIIVCTECIILHNIFKIRRLKNGIAFLKNKDKLYNIGIIGSVLAGITVIVYSILGSTDDNRFKTYLFLGIVIESICMFIWIKQKITKYYKQKLKEKTIEELENEIKEKDKEIKNILEENQRIATINHKYSNRIKALEGFSNKVMSKPEIVENMKVEFGDEFLNFEKQVQKLSKEYTMEMEKNIENKIPKTGIFGIDNILEYMNQEATKINIKFNVKINGNINYMIENIVEQSKLETMLGDHIKDAIIAINSSNNTNKNILLILGIIDEHYEVRIYDTGIEFEIPTLLKLGLEQITTHKETGGSGIGFMTTFETLKNTKASLIIEEKHPMNKTDYTKAVRIKFDGKNEYRIYTYRAEEIKKENKNGRIIITNA